MTAQALTWGHLAAQDEGAMRRDWQAHMDGPYPGDVGNGPFEPWHEPECVRDIKERWLRIGEANAATVERVLGDTFCEQWRGDVSNIERRAKAILLRPWIAYHDATGIFGPGHRYGAEYIPAAEALAAKLQPVRDLNYE